MRTARLLILAVLVTGLLGFRAAAEAPAGSPSSTSKGLDDLPRIDRDVHRRLALPGGPGTSVQVSGIRLGNGRTVSLNLEPFEVWAPDAAIVEHGVDGLRRLPVPSDRYYRGSVVDEPGSLVFLAAGRTLRGLIFSGEDVFAIAPEGDAYDSLATGGDSRVRKIDPERDRPPGPSVFSCSEEELRTPPQNEPLSAVPLRGIEPLYTSTVYIASIAIETDYELYAKFGNSPALTQYVGDLVAASSAIYQRDIQVQKTVGVLHIYSTGAASDPWIQTTTSGLLMELGDYWHATYPLASNPRSTVHLLSGKSLGGGVAWIGTICRADFLCSAGNCGSSAYDGHYGGGYGVSGSLAGQFSTTNPSLYWDLLCFSHEVGHNFNSSHTHCYSPPVDTCCDCAAGTCTGSVPPEKGTIMSYCHLVGGNSAIKLYLAVQAESSVAVYNVMRTFVESRTCLAVSGSPAPTIALVTPNQGPTAGGTGVTITGANFVSGATVTIGGTAATGVVVGSASSITATTPAHAAGAVNVVVTNPDLQSGTLVGGFTYVAGPVVLSLTSLSPRTGPAAGGTGITLSGTGFLAGANVTVGGAAATSINVSSSTTITAATPARPIGPANVVVTNPGGATATIPGGFVYTATGAAPRVNTLTPCRLVDTRNATGSFGGPALSAGEVRSFSVSSGSCGIPADAAGVSLNVTVADATAAGTLTLFPGVGTVPGTNTVSFVPGKNRANNVTMGIVGGVLSVRNYQVSGTVNLIVDVNGYYR